MANRPLRFTLSFVFFALILAAAALIAGMIFRHYSAVPGNGDFVTEARHPFKLVLDPGHGGEDGGAVGYGDMTESQINLALSLKTRDLMTLCGFDVIMTREEDVMLWDGVTEGSRKARDLKCRYQLARSYPQALFLSIHMNKFPQEQYSGLQVYYSPNHPGSAEAAGMIQTFVHRYLQPDNTRLTKPAGSNIYLLDRLTTPACIVECGFLSNRAEAERLCTEEYRSRLAAVITAAAQWYYFGDTPLEN